MARTRVLVVDPEPSAELFPSETLSRPWLATKRVVTAGDALLMVDRWSPELVVVEPALPDVDGFLFLGQLRRRTSVPIVVVSSLATRSDRVRAFSLGADDYVTKPFDPEELEARLRALLRRSQNDGGEPPEMVFVGGSLRIDYRRESVTMAGSPVRLTPTEYRLLRELTLNAGCLMTRSSLQERFWGAPRLGGQEYLSAFIRRLRRKIEPEPRRPVYILAEHRAGYRFVAPEAADDAIRDPSRASPPTRGGLIQGPIGRDPEGYDSLSSRGG